MEKSNRKLKSPRLLAVCECVRVCAVVIKYRKELGKYR